MVQEYLRSSFGAVVAASVTGALLGNWAVGDAFDFYTAQSARLAARPPEVRLATATYAAVDEATPRYYPYAAMPPGAYRPAAYSYYYDEEPVRMKEREGWQQPVEDADAPPSAPVAAPEHQGGPKIVEMPAQDGGQPVQDAASGLVQPEAPVDESW